MTERVPNPAIEALERARASVATKLGREGWPLRDVVIWSDGVSMSLYNTACTYTHGLGLGDPDKPGTTAKLARLMKGADDDFKATAYRLALTTSVLAWAWRSTQELLEGASDNRAALAALNRNIARWKKREAAAFANLVRKREAAKARREARKSK